MRDQKYYIYLTNEEIVELIRKLIKSKNDLIFMGRYTDAVDDLIIKVSKHVFSYESGLHVKLVL